jgi:hypothetical protein
MTAYSELSASEKSALCQMIFINQLEILGLIDDFYLKQRTGIKVILGEKQRIQIPEMELKKLQEKAIIEARSLKLKKGQRR